MKLQKIKKEERTTCAHIYSSAISSLILSPHYFALRSCTNWNMIALYTHLLSYNIDALYT